MMKNTWFVCSALCVLGSNESAIASEEATMTTESLGELIGKVGDKVEHKGSVWRFEVEGFPFIAVSDAKADRMRVMSPVANAEKLEPALLQRMMQANFDSALDARYAIAHGQVWSVFIHPLSSLRPRDFVSGIAQVANCVASYGKSFSSGALVFGGGDSQRLEAERHRRILKRGEIEL